MSTILLNDIEEKIYDYRIISSTIGVTWNTLMSRLRRAGRYIVELVFMAPSSNGEDTALSRRRYEFDSRWGYNV